MARCPICNNRLPDSPETGAAGAPPRSHAPFCSERCKLIDLGNWLGEGYRVTAVDEGAHLDELEESEVDRRRLS